MSHNSDPEATQVHGVGDAADRRRFLWQAIALVAAPAAAAFILAPHADVELKKALYGGAVTLIFAGLLGGLLKLLLDDLATVKRQREDAATFVTNVLSDLKAVYDRVGRAQILIPAHRSAKTYGDEMRDLIESRVQLRNVVRALERRAAGVSQSARDSVIENVRKMESYLKNLVEEFRDKYKPVADLQRAYEKQADVLITEFASAKSRPTPPDLPNAPWRALERDFARLQDLIGDGADYGSQFEAPLDAASEVLRTELASIIGHRSE